MEIQLSNKTETEKQFEVTISVEEMKPYIAHATKKLSENLALKGFRPGKAPDDLVVATVGLGKIWETAAERALEKSFVDACIEHKLDVVASPHVEVLQLAPGNDFHYRATVEFLPEIILPDFRVIASQVREKEKKEIKVEEKEVQSALEWLAKSRATTSAVARAAQNSDVLDIVFEGRIAGVKQENLEGSRQTLVLGEDRLLPGFEKELVGLSVGQEKDFSLTFPKDYGQKALQDKAVDFHVKVESVQERHVPEINDEFAKNVGGFDNLDALKTSIAEGIKFEKDKSEGERVFLKILEAIAKKSTIHIAGTVLEQELDKMMSEFQEQLASMGMNIEAYLAQIKKTEKEIKDSWKDKAKERVEGALVLRAIAKKENIEASEEDVTKRANEYLQEFRNAKEAEKVYGDGEALRGRVKNILRNEKVAEMLKTV
ncbi:MAG: trigger factor [Candidatus Spechtbacteria bacterium]|nr:trigger factor [Candidatus Spechtbacteria bacterium]